ncbi:putative sugar phosphate/phosphate translocator [Vitis vinifera]|uniref:Putative sugar phosphate/phosphate translocator n=1 Tax=Vitis vinifera TaxID=29760 RepID=A0A438JQ58_VITVI|nr:putative sugar phosphate/phosphate translocator [Vitis vinifera]
MIHMAFCSSLAYLLVRVLKLVEPVAMSRELYISSVVPIGALYSLSLWFSKLGVYLSLGFLHSDAQGSDPVAVYSIGVLFKKDSFKTDTMVNMVSISVGVAIAAYGEARFDSWGVICSWVPSPSRPHAWKDLGFDHERCWVVKDWLLIAFSWSVIKDTVTPVNLVGYGLAFLGVAYYNHSKLQALKAKEAQKKAAQADEEAGRLLAGEGRGRIR